MQTKPGHQIGFEAGAKRRIGATRTRRLRRHDPQLNLSSSSELVASLVRTKWVFAIWKDGDRIGVICPDSENRAALVKHLGLYLACEPQALSAIRLSLDIADTWRAAQKLD